MVVAVVVLRGASIAGAGGVAEACCGGVWRIGQVQQAAVPVRVALRGMRTRDVSVGCGEMPH